MAYGNGGQDHSTDFRPLITQAGANLQIASYRGGSFRCRDSWLKSAVQSIRPNSRGLGTVIRLLAMNRAWNSSLLERPFRRSCIQILPDSGLNGGKALFPEFHSVYVEAENFHYYQKHGNFPEGTVLVKELALTQPGKYPDGSLDSPSGRGYFPSAVHGLDVMVKDSKRFGDTNNWGFFTFGHQDPPYEPTAKVMASTECAYCHIAGVAKTDMVWVQFYPLLNAGLH
jgi:hypothetical protein